MKRFIYLLLATIFTLSTLMVCAPKVACVEPLKVYGYTYDDMEYLKTEIAEREAMMAAAHDMAEAARALGYDESHEVILLAKSEHQSYKQERDHFQAIYNELANKWKAKQDEYSEATQVWENLKNAGYSNYVCAGILGNIMTEVGGDTLAIQPLIKTTEYYGMCQWSSYYPEAWGLSLKGQCDFLVSSIERNFIMFGHLYKRDMTYANFKNMTDCRQIALCFAKVYEQCSSASHNARQENAVFAYNYFVS